jgi:LPXTG-site transpeptidase (sortase) family protein
MGKFIQYRPSQKHFALVGGVIILLTGVYTGLLVFAPQLPNIPVISQSPLAINIKDDATDTRNRVVIPKINLEVPYFTGDTEATLDKGAWHRKPEQGNPAIGGNFILSAHRFELGLTPARTKAKSPFYNIDKLQMGDEIKIFFEGKWYTYTVSKKYDVPPTALYIEQQSVTPKITLYSCSLQGAAVGRSVIEAKPAF